MSGKSGRPGPYDDIINLPHHVSATRPQMPRENRAAQFSPFAALTGYESAIKETARLTDVRIELGDSAVAELDAKLSVLTDRIADHPEADITYFRPDEKKDGGAYVVVTGTIKKIDDYERVIVLMSGETIPISDVLDIECGLFSDLI
ncbi:YolD-like family protein [Oscillospiraceae bacterium OttesenSCG-928-G22]|nr:YolD-like family protein [Oscillospiraceae bacterium OttesenSCG-928-G22]